MVKENLNKKIQKYNDRYVIFYSPWCKYSMEAINIMKGKNLPHKAYIIDDITSDITLLFEAFIQGSSNTNFSREHKTRPIIFYKGKFIGGCDKLKEMLRL